RDLLMVDEFEDDDFDAQFEDDENSEEPDFEEEDDSFEEEESFEEETVEESQEESFEEEESGEEDSFEEDDSDDDQKFDKPVSEGEVVEVEIDDLGSKGDGIARVEGFVVFVPGGEVGETYDVEITSVGNKFAFGEITE
ncbi:MAG: TRAM domain-containing protein, partial [Candidatus Nanohalobium sp.]